MVLNKRLKKGRNEIISGDIFEVKLKNSRKSYFQFLYKDDEYMAGHVIRAFDLIFDDVDTVELSNIVRSQVKFIAHTRVFEGMEMCLWHKVGYIAIEQNFTMPVFRQTNDDYSLVKKSSNWFIWQYSPENRKYIGELTEEYKKLPESGIFPPSAIVDWIENGWHGFLVPE